MGILYQKCIYGHLNFIKFNSNFIKFELYINFTYQNILHLFLFLFCQPHTNVSTTTGSQVIQKARLLILV